MTANVLDGLWLPAVDALIKVTLVLGVAGIAAIVLGRASAAMRHLVWTLALTSALVLPVLSVALPRWQLPIVTLTSEAPTEEAIATAPSLARRPRTPEATTSDASAAIVRPTRSAAARPDVRVTPRTSLTMALVAIWAAGVLAVVGRLVVGLIAVRWMSRRTVRVVDAPWLPLAVDLASSLGITRRLTFLESARASMPMAAGIFTPSVLMPEDANRWPLERLRIVLLHELAHVKRRDCLTHVIAQLACALHWFNPLAWVAARHVRTERERACDDLVLACGTRGPDYAEELLEIARVMRGGRYPALLGGATLAMAHRSQLEGRLIAILDPKVPRSDVSPVRAALAAAALACALPPLAAMQPWAVASVEATAAISSSAVPAGAEARAPQAMVAPTPQPQPRPVPSPRPEITSSLGPEIAQAVADSVSDATAQAIVQGAVQGAVQQGVQSAWQGVVEGVVEGVVQGAVQGALHGADLGAIGQDAKRAAADPRLVAALTAALEDSDKDVRETAMHALVQLRDPSIYEPLVQALKDPSPDVREQAAHGLSQLRDKRAVEPLMGALKDTSASVRESVIHALSQLRDPRAVDALIGALKDENQSVREQAAFALGQIRDRGAVEALVMAIKDPSADVREQVAFALGQIRDPRAIDALTGALKDASADVRQQAAFALGQLARQ
jgi:beta-lactamase regulating signal transducer with metallopeptidase domain